MVVHLLWCGQPNSGGNEADSLEMCQIVGKMVSFGSQKFVTCVVLVSLQKIMLQPSALQYMTCHDDELSRLLIPNSPEDEDNIVSCDWSIQQILHAITSRSIQT